jgi:hypothetical protein
MCSIRKLSGTRPRSLCAFASGGPSVLSSTELYDTVTNTFAVSTPAMNYISASATAALLPNGKVLITDWLSNTTELYNSTIDTFAALTPVISTFRIHATATLLPNGKVLIAGGGTG